VIEPYDLGDTYDIELGLLHLHEGRLDGMYDACFQGRWQIGKHLENRLQLDSSTAEP